MTVRDNFFLINFGVKFILFVATISIFLSLGTITIHELGHGLTSEYYGCKYDMTIFNVNELPNTQISCLDTNNLKNITLAGIAATSLFSLLFYFSSTGILKYVAGIIFSIGTIAASLDLTSLNISGVMIFLLNVASYLLLALCVIKVILFYFDKEYVKKRFNQYKI